MTRDEAFKAMETYYRARKKLEDTRLPVFGVPDTTDDYMIAERQFQKQRETLIAALTATPAVSVAEAVAAEREACAQLALTHADDAPIRVVDRNGETFFVDPVAHAIRARAQGGAT